MAMATAGPGLRLLRLAPDWLPNTNHAGFYVAQTLGYFREAGLRLEILPFEGEAMPNRKIVSGETDFGLMPQQSILSMRAHGVDVISVAALVRPNTTSIMVRAESDIQRPAEFAGRRYASFGTDFEVPMLEAMIRHDGGEGSVLQMTPRKLENLAALYAGETDLAWGFYAWEGIQAELAGHALRHFFVAEHGVPPEYFPLLFTTRDLILHEPEMVRAFVAATARGYAYAAAHPSEAADMLLAAIPRPLLPSPAEELLRRSLAWLAPRFAGTFAGTPSPHPWGYHDPHAWAAFAAFIRQLIEAHGLPPIEPGAEARGYTNAFVDRGDGQ
jgi:ABC-type nitrate/sulfonate/bicarbonate transport system substrate-binding protein